MHEAAAVEVYDALFVDGSSREDYEASDLLYESDAYSEYETEHFGGLGVPRTLGGLDDFKQLSSRPVRFLWYAAFATVNASYFILHDMLLPRTAKRPETVGSP